MVVPQSGLLIYVCKKMQDCEELALLHLFVKKLFCNDFSSSKPSLPYWGWGGGWGVEKLKKKK